MTARASVVKDVADSAEREREGERPLWTQTYEVFYLCTTAQRKLVVKRGAGGNSALRETHRAPPLSATPQPGKGEEEEKAEEEAATSAANSAGPLPAPPIRPQQAAEDRHILGVFLPRARRRFAARFLRRLRLSCGGGGLSHRPARRRGLGSAWEWSAAAVALASARDLSLLARPRCFWSPLLNRRVKRDGRLRLAAQENSPSPSSTPAPSSAAVAMSERPRLHPEKRGRRSSPSTFARRRQRRLLLRLAELSSP